MVTDVTGSSEILSAFTILITTAFNLIPTNAFGGNMWSNSANAACKQRRYFFGFAGPVLVFININTRTISDVLLRSSDPNTGGISE